MRHVVGMLLARLKGKKKMIDRRSTPMIVKDTVLPLQGRAEYPRLYSALSVMTPQQIRVVNEIVTLVSKTVRDKAVTEVLANQKEQSFDKMVKCCK